MKELSLLVVLVGCDDGASGELFRHFDDGGEVCIRSASGDPALPANESLTITFDARQCFSSSCTRDLQASCVATLVGRTVTISSEVSWYDLTALHDGCTRDCPPATATCQTPPLAAGDYTFIYGGTALALALPSTLPTRCLR